MTRLGSLVFVLALTAFPASLYADDWSDCRNVSVEEQAISACGRLIARGKLSRDNLAAVYSNCGAAHLNRGEYALALEDLNQSIRLAGGDATAIYNRGATYFFLQEYENAIADLTRAIQLDTSHAKSRYYRGRSNLELGQYDDAIKDFTAGARLDPGNTSFLRFRGQAFLASRDFNSAVADYDQVLARDKGNAPALRERGEAQLNRRAFADAIRDLTEAIRLEPGDAGTWSLRGSAYIKLEQYDAALADLGKALEIDPRAAIARNNRAHALLKLERLDEAMRETDQAFAIEPADAIVITTRGEILEAQGRRAEAVEMYEKALDIDPGLREAADGRSRLRPAQPAPSALSSVPAPPTDPATRRAMLAALQEAYNTFGGVLLDDLAMTPEGQRKNIAISPYSIGSAMAMTLHGASQETEQEMRRALLHSLSRQQLAEANFAGLALLQSDRTGDQRFSLKVANALAFGSVGRAISPAYAADMTESFAAKLIFDATSASINQWVRERTEGLIDSIVSNLPSDFALVIVSAVSMKAQWAEPFAARDTHDEVFTLASGARVLVPMMHKEDQLQLAEAGGFRAVRLPYADPSVAMIVIVPSGAGHFEGRGLGIDGKNLVALLDQLPKARPQLVALALPRFAISFGADLADPLMHHGIQHAFSASAAQFDHMTREPGVAIRIASVPHRVAIKVAELGTEAAAATAVVMAPGEGRPDPMKRVVPFRVDRPFLFLIGDNRSGAILFLGRVIDPRIAS